MPERINLLAGVVADDADLDADARLRRRERHLESCMNLTAAGSYRKKPKSYRVGVQRRELDLLLAEQHRVGRHRPVVTRGGSSR